MGLSASQSRMLTLTARLSDLELKAQDIQNKKIRLAEQSTEASKKYMDALDAQTLKFNYYSTGSVDATVKSITESGLYRVSDVYGNSFQQMDKDTTISYYVERRDSDGNLVTDSDGNVIKDKKTEVIKAGDWCVVAPDGYTYSTSKVNPQHMEDTEWLFEQMQLANLFIQKYDVEKEQWQDYSYIASSIFTTEDDDTNVAKAEAEYEYALAQIQDKDKRYDLDLDNINTEHEAVKTEVESVKGVIKDNTGRTFKIFS